MGSSYLTSLSVLCALLFFVLGSLSHARDTIREGQPLHDGETLISSGGVFEMGFFRPGNSSRRYVGIWYYHFSTDTVLWVANRENPITDTSGSMAIGSSGNLEVLDGRNSVLWTSNVTVSSNSSSATLFNNGNLQLNDSGSMVWQSFDHPTDTYLPGMKVGLDMKTGINQFFTSWKSEDDPAVGNFSMGIDPLRSTQIFIWEGTKPRWRSGRWNGQTFIGIPNMVPTYIYGFKLSNFDQEGKMYFYYSQFNSSHRYVLSWNGIEQHMIWRNDTSVWGRSWAQPITDCELYNKCGNNGICTDSNTPICACLDGFEPVVNEEWNSGNWTRGCARRTPLACVSNDSSTDGFLKIEGVKLPDFSDWVVDDPSTDSCKEKCLRNCSCKAYTYPSGIGCLIWGVDLLDIHQFSSGGSEMYLRLAASEIEDKSKAIVTYVIVPIVLGVLILLIGSVYLIWKYKNRIKVWFRQQKAEEVSLFSQGRSWEKSVDFSGAIELGEEEGDQKCPELPLFTFDSIVAATNNFYFSNLLGEGGFGPVYKGKLPGGREIAVKRLSKSSGQGMGEFKNEVILIAKLQHRNLVRLLGCCIKEEEKILVYEYMPNRSLDIFLFDSKKKELLDWKKRYNIIEGIARGLLYLHRDSRLRIIHRDLKASNILLDEEMNPKISDFGLARITGSDENQANTKRVVGTYGYMSPEYAMQGLFSVKSDVYSFGVLLLEIVSGKRNSVFHDPESKINLLANAWQLWNENRAMEFVDTSISYSCTQREVLRCINVGLMCVQDHPIDRPTMSSVIIMLESETIAQPSPRPPTFTAQRSHSNTESSSIDFKPNSAEVSITTLTGR